MIELFALAVAGPAACLIATAAIPPRATERWAARLRSGITGLTGLYAILSASMAVAFAGGWMPTLDVRLLGLSTESPLGVTVYYDGVTSLMLALVTFVGWVICRYSIRYLDGDPHQGRYFCWAAFTIGAVSLMVCSGNLLMFVACWVMTSLGLHHLLLHYGERPAARRAAWTKFAISRVGDLALLGSLALIYAEYQTLRLGELFAAIGEGGGEASTTIPLAGFLLVIGAITKSAQFPVHSWLPQTMETPTPVSALMHAGIVNAGGYLIIRVSPLLEMAPWALMGLAIVGGWTACFAAVVMLTQSSIKRSLAYSTIAQMGFMMLQCGLGAYSAAMLHLIAHSLYKAHAFLSSGSVLSHRASMDGPLLSRRNLSVTTVAGTGLLTAGLLTAALVVCGIDLAEKPGGLILGGILWVAVTHWMSQVVARGDLRLMLRASLASAVLCLAYAASYAGVDALISSAIPAPSAGLVNAIGGSWFAAIVIGSLGCGLLVLAGGFNKYRGSDRWRQLYVHVINGFYLESRFRRLLGSRLST